MLKTGITNTMEITVDEEQLASSLGSGGLRIFSTPSMITLMEGTAFNLVEPLLSLGQTTVGTRLEISHLSATPSGLKVRCTAELVEIDGRRLVFSLQAFDPCGLIGEGRHERFIVDIERFLKKAAEKKHE